MENELATLHEFDDPKQEMERISNALKMSVALQALTKEDLTFSEKADVALLLVKIRDLLGVEVPKYSGSVVSEISNIGMSSKWSKLLREKALASTFRLVYMIRDPDTNLPIVATLVDPDTEEPFDEISFIKWMSKKTAMNQTMVFQRMGAYRKLLSLGYSLERAFETILKRPYLVQETLNTLVEKFDSRGKIIEVDPRVALGVSKTIQNPEAAKKLEEAVDRVADNPTPENHRDLIKVYEDTVVQAVEEVVSFESPKDASRFLNNDLMGKPEIAYTIEDGSVLVVRITSTIIEGDRQWEEEMRIPFVPEMGGNSTIPVAVIKDLIERLPIKNRREALRTLDRMLDN